MEQAAIALCGVFLGVIGMLLRTRNGKTESKPGLQAGAMGVEWWMDQFERMEKRIIEAIREAYRSGGGGRNRT